MGSANALLLLVLGLAALVLGAELVVRYGSLLARRLGISPMIIGLTIVSIGTSAPELAVGIDAMGRNAGSLAVGNIAGTNIVNIALILGLSATISAISFERRTLVLDLPGMSIAAVLLLALTADGRLDRWEGIPLTLAAVAYLVLLGLWARRDKRNLLAQAALEATPDDPVAPATAEPHDTRDGSPWWQLLILIAGLVVIVVGADWLVSGSTSLALAVGVSDAFIGLTIVAIGTSAPELATTVLSTLRGDRDIAVGNLIGSSVLNLTLILGLPVLIANGSGPIESHLLHIDVPIMVAVSLLCIPLFLTGKRLSRVEGAFLVVGYVVYLTYLLLART